MALPELSKLSAPTSLAGSKGHHGQPHPWALGIPPRNGNASGQTQLCAAHGPARQGYGEPGKALAAVLTLRWSPGLRTDDNSLGGLGRDSQGFQCPW